jgi:hypothetical protein
LSESCLHFSPSHARSLLLDVDVGVGVFTVPRCSVLLRIVVVLRCKTLKESKQVPLRLALSLLLTLSITAWKKQSVADNIYMATEEPWRSLTM